MSSDNESRATETESAPPPPPAVGATRRRLLRGGLLAGPVVWTVSAKSVMAQGMGGRCTTASAYGSINASRPSNLTHCGGHRPHYWARQQHHDEWPVGYTPVSSHHGTRVQAHATRFTECFGQSSAYQRATLLEVLSTRSGGQDEVARLCAAAMLNAAKGLTPPHVLGATVIRDVWQSYSRRGYYEPTAGIRWYADASEPAGTGGIVEWLQSTMPR